MIVYEFYFKPKSNIKTSQACYLKSSGLWGSKWTKIQSALTSDENVLPVAFDSKTRLIVLKVRIPLDTHQNEIHQDLKNHFHSSEVIYVALILADSVANPVVGLYDELVKADGYKGQITSD